jgi:hypothetical protein
MPDAAAATISILREFGALVIFMGLLAWFARGLKDKSARAVIALVLFLAYTVSAIFTITNSLNGSAPSGDIYYAILDIVIAAGLGYFRFIKPE